MDGWSHFGQCPICKERAASIQALVAHLDKWHIGWVQEFFRAKGFAVPDKYPVRRFRMAVAALMASESVSNTLQ